MLVLHSNQKIKEEVEINNPMFQTWNDASSVVGSNILTCPTLTNGTQYITGH